MEYREFYVNGAWKAPLGTDTFEVIDPTTELVFAIIPAGSVDDVEPAVAAARAAFPEWAQTPPAARADLLNGVAELLDARRSDLAEIEAHEIGCPRTEADSVHINQGMRGFKAAAEILRTFEFEDRSNGWLLREPVGVVGAITPWNYPLNQISAKVAYALAAGCTVVLKPSEVAPISAFVLAEMIDEVGFPPGVFNLITGLGPIVGEALAAHPDVDMISFTGSTRAGKRVAQVAAETVKRVALELGGKSPNVILDDADLSVAVPAGVRLAYSNCGQACVALSRMIVPRSRLAEVEQIACEAVESYTVGNPMVEGTKLGPLVSEAQRDRVRGYINKGIEEGAILLTGGPDAPEGLDRGFFVRPTVFSNVRNDMTIAREEIFGPVLSIIPYDSEDEAVEIANDTIYGLSAAVFGSEERAQRVARELRAGQVRVNVAVPKPTPIPQPFGGFKQSGLGRENGIYGLEEFLELKALWT
jgi:acyl-CoA reductase-like NAD-dependent aldehyde dehydrogenase